MDESKLNWNKTELSPDYRMYVRAKLLEPMLGTVPADREVYERYIVGKIRKELKKKSLGEEERRIMEEALARAEATEVETVQETEEKGFTNFHRDTETGELFLYDYAIRGFLKSAAEALKSRHDLTNHRHRIHTWVFVGPRKVMLGQSESDGVLERPLRGMTAQGPRVALAKSEVVAPGTEFDFHVDVMHRAKMPEKALLDILRYGMFQGFGQFRSGSYGRFTFAHYTESFDKKK